jgi:hypothetical protein
MKKKELKKRIEALINEKAFWYNMWATVSNELSLLKANQTSKTTITTTPISIPTIWISPNTSEPTIDSLPMWPTGTSTGSTTSGDNYLGNHPEGGFAANKGIAEHTGLPVKPTTQWAIGGSYVVPKEPAVPDTKPKSSFDGIPPLNPGPRPHTYAAKLAANSEYKCCLSAGYRHQCSGND